jgi:UDP-glucose 4-epimerase
VRAERGLFLRAIHTGTPGEDNSGMSGRIDLGGLAFQVMSGTCTPETTWLLTGGAGYIGAHIVRSLQQLAIGVVVLDDMTDGVAENIPADVPLVQANILDTPAVEQALRQHNIDGVIHLAAKKAVGESVERPLHYYEQNVLGTHSLLTAMEHATVKNVMFSSSAAVYGETGLEVVNEESPTVPTSPYGETKLISEWMIKDQARATGLSYVSLRYFNVAGAGSAELGDRGVFNLVPIVLRALTRGERPKVFGADYATRDGSCIRDYIHVADLADAHATAVVHLNARRADGPQTMRAYNVGTGTGTTVLEVMDAVREVTGIDFEPEVVGRRAGDPARVVGSPDRINRELGWAATRSLHDMVASAWEAFRAFPPTRG